MTGNVLYPNDESKKWDVDGKHCDWSEHFSVMLALIYKCDPYSSSLDVYICIASQS